MRSHKHIDLTDEIVGRTERAQQVNKFLADLNCDVTKWNCRFFVKGEDSSQGGTSRNKQSQIPPDSRRYYCTSKRRAKALEGADFLVRSLHTAGQDQQKFEADIPIMNAGAIRHFLTSYLGPAACRKS